MKRAKGETNPLNLERRKKIEHQKELLEPNKQPKVSRRRKWRKGRDRSTTKGAKGETTPSGLKRKKLNVNQEKVEKTRKVQKVKVKEELKKKVVKLL